MEEDLEGIIQLLRTHIEVRNRSWMKRIHRDCFIGSDAVDFLVTQGFADTREIAVKMGRKMVSKKLIRHVTDSHNFRDAYLYYRFAEDDSGNSVLASSNAGNGKGTVLGQGGCKWNFCPHTAHNSFVLDIALAEEIERAVAGASVEARARAIGKLRARVREQAEPDAPDWMLTQSTIVNQVSVSVYTRKRPRGDFKNVKITGMVPESPKRFISGIMSFDRRKQWESMFEDGVIVEAIDIGDPPSSILSGDDTVATAPPTPTAMPFSPSPFSSDPTSNPNNVSEAVALPEGVAKGLASPGTFARTTDDLVTFLQTVDLAGVPKGMPIAFLNDPERQHALAHLRKQMMLSNPQECMLCQAPFDSPADIRFCPCCAMVSCVTCVSKRVFEVVSRQVVSVCIHCCRESSRIRHPPQVVQDASGLDASLRGKWWRPEELGMIDYSLSSSVVASSYMTTNLDPDAIQISGNVKPLVPGLLDNYGDADGMGKGANENEDNLQLGGSGSDNEGGGDEDEEEEDVDADVSTTFPAPPSSSSSPSAASRPLSMPISMSDNTSAQTPNVDSKAVERTARCKSCGELISRDMDAIEQHMEECIGIKQPGGGGGGGRSSTVRITMNDPNTVASLRFLGGIPRHTAELEKCDTRIIYRTARTQSTLFKPREVCALQDAFMDADGTCYLYEISVRHCDVRGTAGHVTADVLLLMHVARPIKGSKGTCNITTISQVNTRAKGTQQWLLSFLAEDGVDNIGVPRQEDLVRELKSSGNLLNILRNEQNNDDDNGNKCSLEDFELMAVLGRGGFGKVMQVRHIPTDVVYAMKILKKSELCRRRQVERTQTERTILAAVRHPFIVCLHYAFQNQQKLYMVMDFVQGGDFFTLMRKFKRLPEDWVRMYIGQIAMALNHLHSMDVVYRDLKPENILLCGDGYVKLTDFGLSRFFETRPPAAEDMIGEDDVVTRSFCGTEQYMSPEMLLQQGHNYRMDWWCLGLLMHEMISARHPFHGPSHYDTLRNMVTKQPTIDQRLSKNSATVVRSLLIKNPRARLCCREGISELKALPFFADVDWEALYDKKVDMPYIPELRDMTDVSSFETTFTREAAIDSISEMPKESKNKSGKKGIMGLFGLGGSSATKSGEGDGDAFKDFAFAKDDSLLVATTTASSSSSIAADINSININITSDFSTNVDVNTNPVNTFGNGDNNLNSRF